MNVRIEVDALVLRSWETKDASALSLIGNDEHVEANMNDGFPKPFTEEKAVRFIENAGRSVDIFLAIEHDGQVVGSIGAFFDASEKGSAVIAYFVGRRYWNRGFASSAVKGIVEYLVHERGIEKVSAEPFERNNGSRKVLEKNGFELADIQEAGTRKGNAPVSTCLYEFRRGGKAAASTRPTPHTR